MTRRRIAISVVTIFGGRLPPPGPIRQLDVPPEKAKGFRAAYGRGVAVLPVDRVSEIIRAGGFEPPVQFLQTGLIHAWYSRVEHSDGR